MRETDRIIAEWCGFDEFDSTDLNAMHEAEKVVGERWLGTWYTIELDYIVNDTLDEYVGIPVTWREVPLEHIYNLAHATAGQRAEALVRVIEAQKGE